MQLNRHNAVHKHDFSNKCIGIWGYGVTGAAAVDYFQQQHAREIMVLDEQTLPYGTQQTLAQKNVTVYDMKNSKLFFEQADYILKSPGIPCNTLEPRYTKKIIAEFDIFAASWQSPIIAITGTVGKTSITSLLHQLLHTAQTTSVTGGNIGTPMLALLTQPVPTDYAIIELSSFHTELGISIAPDLAIITNIYPNHLDRHGSVERYRDAKLELIRHQTPQQKALLPLSRAPYVQRPSQDHTYAWFSLHEPSLQERSYCAPTDTWYYAQGDKIIRAQQGVQTIIGLRQPTTVTFIENILILTAACDMLGISLPTHAWDAITIPAHRLAPIATHHDIIFYNDSKSTVPAATLAAIQQLSPHKPVLFLGGISKGVDRRPFIKELQGAITLAACFGGEALQLAQWCHEYNIPAYAEPTLEAAYQRYVQQHATAGDHVLFSPAGASFDLFKNYVERGERFIELVRHRS